MSVSDVARLHAALLALLVVGCATETVELLGPGIDAGWSADAAPADAAMACQTPPNLAGADVAFAPEFANLYRIFDLGQIEGVPNALGGITVKHGDPNLLLVAGSSETADGAIYEVPIRRGTCGHIIGFAGPARPIAQAPYVDATLAYAPGRDLLFYAEFPKYTLSQLRFGAAAPAARTDLARLGLPTRDDKGPGGLGFVPPGLSGGTVALRMVTWPAGAWYEVALDPSGDLFAVRGITRTTSLPNNPGGVAYVPAGSRGFVADSVIVSEWRKDDPTLDRVALYEVDGRGNPLPATRREFLAKFPRPWGAYFEPLTGDFMFLSWGTGADRVFIIQGFVPPPPVD